MWNIKEIINNKNRILERLKTCTDEEEREVLESSLINNIILIEKSEKVSSKLYKLIDRLTTPMRYVLRENERVYNPKIFLEDDYLLFLLNLCDNVASSEFVSIDEFDFDYLKFDEVNLKRIIKEFYKQLDKELYDKSKILINDSDCVEYKIQKKNEDEDSYGLTINDYATNKCYIKISIHNYIIDYQVFEHEVMHGIDFYLGKKNINKVYPGFIEIPTYTVDHLFINFLNEKDFNDNQVQFLRAIKDNYLERLAIETKESISKIIMEKCDFDKPNELLKEMRKGINYQLVRQLLEIESGVIAYGLYKQTLIDKEYGINNLKKLIKTPLPLDKKPDFSFIGLSDDKLLELSNEIGSYSRSFINNKKVKVM